MRFILFVEGKTEKTVLSDFIRRWLNGQFRDNIGINVVKFEGWPQYLKDVGKKAQMHLNGPRSDDIIGVIGLLDLCGPTIYPRDATSAGDRYTWGKQAVEESVNHPQFRHFFAVHEVEEWLLSQPGIFPAAVASALRTIGPPESVNSTTPPAKLLDQTYLRATGRGYHKVVNGKQLFAKLDVNVAYSSCPHLKLMLDEMAVMAQAKGLRGSAE